MLILTSHSISGIAQLYLTSNDVFVIFIYVCNQKKNKCFTITFTRKPSCFSTCSHFSFLSHVSIINRKLRTFETRAL